MHATLQPRLLHMQVTMKDDDARSALLLVVIQQDVMHIDGAFSGVKVIATVCLVVACHECTNRD